MAAGLVVRSSTLLAQQQQKLQSSLVQGVPISQQIQSQTFHGIFLDRGVAVICATGPRAATDRVVAPINPKQPKTRSNILRAMTNLLTVPQPKARRDSEAKYSNDDS
ncbi:hypothetical protein BYT27DRAFT_7203426 [Phlegmacium glaucopus]|nr:hypothetical protein BYT27DRAFT_7203426 [Phlegmacium glaucopus]